MKNITNKIFEDAILNYINESKKRKFFFTSSQETEQLYLNHHKKRYIYILKKVLKLFEKSKLDQIRILEIGFSPFSFILCHIFGPKNVTILDHNILFKKCITELGASFINKDLTKKYKLKKQAYDCVIYSEVFEHVFKEEKYSIEQLTNSLKKGGFLIFTTPNFSSLKNLGRFVRGKNLTPLHQETLHSKGDLHIREYCLTEILSILSIVKNIKIIESKYVNYYEDIKTLII